MVRAAFVILAVLLAACSSDSEPVHIPVSTVNGVACNPFSMGHCALPIPSSAWEREDDTSATGRRLDLPGPLLPDARTSDPDIRVAFNPAPYNRADGWTPGMSIFLTFDHAIDDANLVTYATIADSVGGNSTTLLLDAETGELVGHFAELDKNHLPDFRPGPAYADRGLLIRPASALKVNRRYVVAITKDLRRQDGGGFTSPPAFAALRDGRDTDHAGVEAVRSSYQEIFGLLADAGIARDRLLIAWDFHTASDDYLFRDILAMRDAAMQELGDTGIGYTIDRIVEDDDNLHLRIEGTFESPLFLEAGGNYVGIYCDSGDFRKCPPPGLVRNEAGIPQLQGTWDRPFIITIPAAATMETLPVVQFGHGLLGGGGEILSGYNKRVANEWGVVFAATDWTGLAFEDVPAVAALLNNFNRLSTLTERLGQGLIDAMALTRTLHQIAADPVLQFDPEGTGTSHPAYQTDEIFFYGISLGGTQGGSFMALSPDVKRGVLNVPGAAWSLMMQRSSNWGFYGNFMDLGYPNSRDQQILLVLSQILFDFSDPIAYAHRVIETPFPATPEKQILLQQAIEDSQVPNIATEKMARAMGIPNIIPTARAVWGMDEATEARSGLTVWDENLTPLTPTENTPPPDDNRTHGTNRSLTEVKAETQRFLLGDGLIVNPCGGPCIYVDGELQAQ